MNLPKIYDIKKELINGTLKTAIMASIDKMYLRKSAWNKGLKAYMYDFIEDIDMDKLQTVTNYENFEKLLLNGAENWHEYSWGGCSLIYNEDIACRLCSPSELKKTKNGQNRPNSHEDWLDTQKRALYQASKKLFNLIFVRSELF